MPPPVAGSEVVLGPVETTQQQAETSIPTDDGDGDGGPGGFGSGFVGLVNTSAPGAEGLIEDPAASGGDSSLWPDGGSQDEDEGGNE